MICVKRACSPKNGFLALSLLLVCFGSSASAQVLADTHYVVGYYGNANTAGFPDAQLNIVNPGSTGGYSFTDFKTPIGDLCANIYVFTSDQEMVECCSCFISPNGQLQLSLNLNLTANPLANSTQVPLPVAGAIKVVSSSPFANDTCTESRTNGGGTSTLDVAGTTYAAFGSLRAWNTHVRETVGGTTPLFTVTETGLRQADLSPDGTELSKIQQQCFFLQNTGSGHGRCTCGSQPI
jgi:hypothetical protein